jgi:hypothetical protein
MTPLQQHYLAKLRATADANVAFFERNMPQVHRLLVQDSPSASVDISDQGDLTIRYADGRTKSVTADVLAKEGELARFADLEARPQLLAFHKLRRVQENPSHGDMQRYHYSNLDAEYPNELRRHFTEHYPDNTDLHRYPDFGPGEIPLLIVLGSDLGWHLPRLLTEYKVRHLILIDLDIDDFRLSTFFHDYVLLSRLAMERGTMLTFIIQPDLENVSRMLMNVLRKILPPFFIHGACLFYAMENDAAIEAIKTSVVETLWEMFFGLGYFDDELISIQHTFQNLARGYPIYSRPGTMPADAVAFIVGSGPSLDALMPILKAHGEQAVIFSCGTSLSALAHAGIKPAFHVEKERPYIVYEVLTKTVGEPYLKELRFLGLNVVHQDVFDLFKSSGVILKAADTMATLLTQYGVDKEIILNTQPTVTNTALDFALSIGFRQVYLFGCDMGYKDRDKHHSTHTAYLNKMPEADHLKRLLSKRQASNIIVPGNFGGEVATTNILAMSRQHMEHAIAKHPGARVFNLNDGALIRGATPLHGEEFDAGALPPSNAPAIDAIVAAQTEMRFDLEAMPRQLLDQIDQFIADVQALLDPEPASRMDVIDRIARLYEYMFNDPVASTPMLPLYRGTLLHLASLTYNAVTIIKDEDEARAKAQYDFAVIIDFLERSRREIADVISALRG